jgi:hypothetical protein
MGFVLMFDAANLAQHHQARKIIPTKCRKTEMKGTKLGMEYLFFHCFNQTIFKIGTPFA